jgi:hypothetical protein
LAGLEKRTGAAGLTRQAAFPQRCAGEAANFIDRPSPKG